MTAKKDPMRERSTMSRVDVEVSDETRAAWEMFCEIVGTSGAKPGIEFLHELDEPRAHHRPRLEALIRAVQWGQLT